MPINHLSALEASTDNLLTGRLRLQRVLAYRGLMHHVLPEMLEVCNGRQYMWDLKQKFSKHANGDIEAMLDQIENELDFRLDKIIKE